MNYVDSSETTSQPAHQYLTKPNPNWELKSIRKGKYRSYDLQLNGALYANLHSWDDTITLTINYCMEEGISGDVMRRVLVADVPDSDNIPSEEVNGYQCVLDVDDLEDKWNSILMQAETLINGWLVSLQHNLKDGTKQYPSYPWENKRAEY